MLGITRTIDFYCYLIASLTALTRAVDIRNASLTDTLQQEIITQHDSFKIRHATPRFRYNPRLGTMSQKRQYMELNEMCTLFRRMRDLWRDDLSSTKTRLIRSQILRTRISSIARICSV